MSEEIHKRQGYSFQLVNIECLPASDHFNIVLDLDQSVEDLLPHLAACLPGCTYIHGAGVINVMDAGHIVAIYPRRITITDVHGLEEAERLCRHYVDKIAEVRAKKGMITPAFEKRSSLNVLDILKALPRTNCAECGCASCMAFAAKVFRREAPIAACEPLMQEKAKVAALFHQLRINGYEVS